MIVLDTNVLSETMRPKPARQVMAWLDSLTPHQVFMSSPTQAEILLGIELMPDGKRRAELTQKVAALLTGFFENRCLPFDAQATPHFARIVASRRKAGKPISAEDAQIAAIAVSRGYRVATRNVADFAGVVGLDIVNPWDFVS